MISTKQGTLAGQRPRLIAQEPHKRLVAIQLNKLIQQRAALQHALELIVSAKLPHCGDSKLAQAHLIASLLTLTDTIKTLQKVIIPCNQPKSNAQAPRLSTKPIRTANNFI